MTVLGGPFLPRVLTQRGALYAAPPILPASSLVKSACRCWRFAA